jgi:hypothetical protein
MRIFHRGLLVVAWLSALAALHGCESCQQPQTEAPPKAVSGNPLQPPSAAQEETAIPAKEACAVLVFVNEESGPAPYTAQLTAEGDCTSGNANVDWDFGDGSPRTTGKTVVHTFEKPGSFTVTGKITSDELPGVEDSDTVDVTVTAPPPS